MKGPKLSKNMYPQQLGRDTMYAVSWLHDSAYFEFRSRAYLCFQPKDNSVNICRTFGHHTRISIVERNTCRYQVGYRVLAVQYNTVSTRDFKSNPLRVRALLRKKSPRTPEETCRVRVLRISAPQNELPFISSYHSLPKTFPHIPTFHPVNNV